MKTLLVAFVAVGLSFSHVGAEEIVRATPQEMDLSAGKLDEITTIVQTMVDKHQTAGAVVLVARRGKIVYLGVCLNTCFDLDIAGWMR